MLLFAFIKISAKVSLAVMSEGEVDQHVYSLCDARSNSKLFQVCQKRHTSQ